MYKGVADTIPPKSAESFSVPGTCASAPVDECTAIREAHVASNRPRKVFATHQTAELGRGLHPFAVFVRITQ